MNEDKQQGLRLEGQERLGHDDILAMARNLDFIQSVPGSH